MNKTVFYSWQSDLPNATNRNFILDALEKAARAIVKDETIDVTPVIDRDTAGVPGAPDISTTILAKIDAANMVVLDVSIISGLDVPRPTPNPNVLVELGYAVRALGWENVVLVMNRAFGGPEYLPFDLRSRRATVYELSPGTEQAERLAQKKTLQSVLEATIRAAIVRHAAGKAIEQVSSEELAITAIQNAAPNRGSAIRRFVGWVFEQLSVHDPRLGNHTDTPEQLIAALDQTKPIVETYSRVAVTAAEMDDRDSCMALHVGLEPIAALYHVARSYSGTVFHHQFDYWRFIGHELFLSLIGSCVRMELWEALSELLNHDLLIPNTDRGPGSVPFTYHRQGVILLSKAKQELNSVFPRAQLLKNRHPSSAAIDFDALAAADLFLFMRSELPPIQPHDNAEWFAELLLLSDQTPRFLFGAARVPCARRLAAAVDVKSPELMRERLFDRRGLLTKGLIGEGVFIARVPVDEAVVHQIASRS